MKVSEIAGTELTPLWGNHLIVVRKKACLTPSTVRICMHEESLLSPIFVVCVVEKAWRFVFDNFCASTEGNSDVYEEYGVPITY